MSSRTPIWRSPAPTLPPATDLDTDICVVGAGIVGLSLARMLGEAGHDVVVLTAHELGDSVTGRSNAKVTALHRVVYDDLTRRHGADAAAAYAGAQVEAMTWLRERAGEVWQVRDAATVATSDDALQVLVEEARAARLAGLPVRMVDAVESFPGAPPGLLLPDQGQVDPVALLHRMADDLPSGVALRQGRVTSVRPGVRGATVRGTGFKVRARHVVVATGLPFLDRGLFFSLCEPQASYLLAFAQDPSAVPASAQMCIAVDDPTRSIRWAGSAEEPVLLVGGQGHRTGAGDPSAAVAALEAWARASFDGLGRHLSTWSAEDFVSADRLPHAGPLLRFGGPVHVVTGLSKWGFTLGVACAAALARRLSGEPAEPFDRLVDPARLPDAGAVPSLARSQAEVGRWMTQEWATAMARRAPEAPAEGEGGVGRRGLAPTACATVDGQTTSRSAVCPHLGGIVRWNAVDQTWDCPLHGSRFTHDGDMRHGPATRDLAG